MSTSLLGRTGIVAVYLVALLLHGRADTVTGLIAVAITAVWAIPLLRDGRQRRTSPATAVRPHSRLRPR
jgi:Co/Zn/Cd efflux system component